jgi:hypothetical protein
MVELTHGTETLISATTAHMPDAETILRVILNPEKFENRPLGRPFF